MAVQGLTLFGHVAAIGNQPQMVDIVRELDRGRHDDLAILLQDFKTPRRRRDQRYYVNPSRPMQIPHRIDALAWDFVGSEFGNRHQQYEKFYGGASFLVKQSVNRFYDYKRATTMVDAALALPSINLP